MSVIWMVSDTFRRDHLGAYGNNLIPHTVFGRACGQRGEV